MEISITAVTRNRKFSKSLVRHAGALAPLRCLVEEIDTSTLPFDVLQLVFIDKGEDCINAIGCKRDRLFQIEVSIPSDNTPVDFANESAFVRFIVHQLERSTNLCNLSDDDKLIFFQKINHFYDE